MADSFSVALSYTGGRRYAAIPAQGFQGRMTFKLWGAGGGPGGYDSHHGGNGAGGGFVQGEVAVSAGDLIEVYVGQGGQMGGTGSGYNGGPNGKSHKDYAGGAGGQPGPAGSSGGGGGGGGATALYVKGALRAIAGGGGGGGGGGNRGPYPYGQEATGSYSPPGLYTSNSYTPSPYIDVYVGFLNQYGIWERSPTAGYTWNFYEPEFLTYNDDSTYSWNVYFPATTTYTFNVSGDNYGNIAVDGSVVAIAYNWNYVASASTTVTQGWHTVSMYGVNYGGAAAVAGQILQNGVTEIWNSRSSRTPGLGHGYNGGNCNSDGGGGGGGGGGYQGGPGGQPREYYDNGGYAGANGLNFLSGKTPQTTGQYGNYRTPGGVSDPSYPGGVGYGGEIGVSAGQNGYALLTFYNSTGVYVKENGVYRSVQPSLKVNTGFSPRALVWVNIGGTWRAVSSNNSLSFASDSTNWGG